MKIGLVLGGGGARGFAHIGVLRRMEELGIEAVAIAGCSIGGIVGAMYAAGMTWSEIAGAVRGIDALRLLDRSRMGSLFGSKGIARELERSLPSSFEQLRIPLAVVAVDVQAGHTVVLRSGPLVPALRATSALPGIFSPVDYEGRILIDGGVIDNVPVGVARAMTLEPLVAVAVSPPPDRRLAFDDDRSFWEKLKEPLVAGKRPLVVELFMKAVEIPAALLTEVRLTTERPEVLIRPQLDPDLKVEDFKRLGEAVDAGYRAACDALPGSLHS